MKKQILDSKNRQLVMAALLITILGAGCAKTREASFPEGAGENVFEAALFTKGDVGVVTAAEEQSLDKPSRILRPGQQASKVHVREARAPEALRPMFKGLDIAGRGEKSYSIRFKLDRQFVTAFRVVEDPAELSEQDLELVQVGSVGEKLLPIFQYRIQGYGRVVRSRNDLGEETSTLRLKPTEWKDATHVQVSTLPEDRILVAAPSREQAERIFVRAQLDGQVFSKGELESELDIRVARGARFHAVVDGSELLLQEIVPLEDASITASQREQIAAQDRGMPASRDISRCSEDLRKKVSLQDCVQISRYRVPLTQVEARRRAADADGTLSAEIEFRPVTQGVARLVQIQKDPLVAEVGGSSLDPRRSIRVAEASKAEFLFRRTMEDSPNSFDYTFAGEAGPLEIVRFVFEKDKLRIVRTDAMIPTRGGNRVDLMDLMSMPVQYVREEKTDAQGNLLAVPRVVPADASHPDAVAYVSWESNSVPPVSSPLNYYELGQCFAGATDVTVSGVDNRLSSDGILGFSLNTTYANNPGMDCAGVLSAGYFDRRQEVFTFQERISIRRHAPASAAVADSEKPLLDLPFSAQKKLGFGIFTYSKNSPNQYGNVGTDGTVTPLPAIFDIRQGRKIRYVLAGLPQDDAELRSRLIDATREVIADWNEAYRKALEGTPMERKDDVLELVVEGEPGVPRSALGDLDVNHIYYIPKRTSSGVIGLGGAHSNPRSGRVEAASVFIYGGNINSYIESMKELRKARDQFIKDVASPLVTATAPIRVSGGAAQDQSDRGSLLPSKKDAGIPDLESDRMRAAGAALAHRSGMSVQDRVGALSRLSKKPAQLAFYEAFAQGVKEGSLANPRRMQALVSQKLVEVLAGRLPSREMARLKLDAARSETISKFFGNLQKANLCAFEAPEFSPEMLDAEKSDLDLSISVYRATLAHELGHNLGLRHNFIGSFDKANWKFAPSEKSDRDYSSVMDYLASDEHYDGIGPQDVAAIRAAYSGMIETNTGELISLAEVRKRAGISSWNDLTTEGVRLSKVKAMPFCSDEDAGFTPVCNRFDRGTTPAEVVKASVEDYQQLYSLRNFAGNRLGYSVLGTGGYVGRLFGRFLPIRQFLEETIFQLVQGSSEANAYAEAAFAGLDFFHSVIRSPDAPEIALENERVMATRLEDGRTVKIERKWLKDVRFDGDSDRLRIRGVEFDKVIALILLSERQLGFARYEAADLRFSYPELERLVFSNQVKSPLELPTVGLLADILSNRLRPAGLVIDDSGHPAGVIPLDSRFKSEASDMMRQYAMLAGVLFQDVDGMESKDNGARLFRVMSAFSARPGVLAVARPGASRSDEDQLKYWAPEDAVASKSLVDRVLLLEQVRELREPIVGGYAKFLAKVSELAQAQAADTPDAARVEELQKEAQAILKATNDALSVLPAAAGARKLEALVGAVEQVVAAATALEQAKKTYDPHKLELAIEQRRTQVSGILKANPVLSELLSALSQAEGAPEMLGKIAGASNDAERGVIFSNIEMLNRFTLMAHPEFRR